MLLSVTTSTYSFNQSADLWLDEMIHEMTGDMKSSEAVILSIMNAIIAIT